MIASNLSMNLDQLERSPRHITQVLCALAVAASAFTAASAQTHKVAKPETVVRAVGVYEWTGDMAKPAASRLIPVSLFINGLRGCRTLAFISAAPIPMSLLTQGTMYQLQKLRASLSETSTSPSRATLSRPPESTTTYATMVGSATANSFPQPWPKKSASKPTTTLAKINGIDEDDAGQAALFFALGGSWFGRIGHADRWDHHRAGGHSGRPIRIALTLHRSPTQSGSGSSGGSGSGPADDPDRPTLRRRSPEEAKNAKGDQNSVTAVPNSLNDDPNRPVLHRGKPTSSMSEADIPKLSGLPGDQDLKQIVGVSDAQDHPPHDFSRAWDDENEHQAILAKMQAAARQQLAAYEAANSAAPAPAPPPPAPKTAAGRTRRTAAKPVPPPAAPPEALMDEKLVGYTLSYGGAPTYVYYAHTDGLGSAQRFVTLVAQVNMQGEPEIALKNVTDAAHLDRTPRMRLVDAVDAEASNRASLLFELRSQNSRQFALYRVIGARADQTFLTGSTQ